MSKKRTIVFTTVPLVEDDTPLATPAMLKAVAERHGYPAVGLDLNIDILNMIRNHPLRDKFLDFFYNQKIHPEITRDLRNMLNFYVEELLGSDPDIIGLSLFSHQSQVFTAWLCAVIREIAPDKKILIGGPGLQTLENSFFKYPDRLKRLGLIDDYITGDAETSLIEFLKGNVDYPGINRTDWEPPDLSLTPIPDYSDYRFVKYPSVSLPIIDSRGCVQSCEFCDVIAFWKKFRYLTADQIFAQMLDHIERYSVYDFQFSSSICNGNLREFKKLLKLIADHNTGSMPSAYISWIGSFIVRPAKHHKEDLFQLIKVSNGHLICGVETITEKARKELGKNFSNADLDHHLEMCAKYDILVNFLAIADYPRETVEDRELVKQWFIDRKHYAGNPIRHVQLTMTGILPGTKLSEEIDAKQFFEGLPDRKEWANELASIITTCGFQVVQFF